ncbi:MAG: hypothetical protein J6X31_01655, partial [Bacteroidales bacterium]|nr:hypothetical protein [Bacteroidales bacterium]
FNECRLISLNADDCLRGLLNEFENEGNSAFKNLNATSRAIEFSNSHQFNTDILSIERKRKFSNSLILENASSLLLNGYLQLPVIVRSVFDWCSIGVRSVFDQSSIRVRFNRAPIDTESMPDPDQIHTQSIAEPGLILGE